MVGEFVTRKERAMQGCSKRSKFSQSDTGGERFPAFLVTRVVKEFRNSNLEE